MFTFKNPLDTEFAREDEGWKIGDRDPDTKQIYAGPKYGMKSEEEYNKLLQSGALGRGQQAVELAGQQIVEHGKDIYDTVGEYIPDLPEASPEVKQAIETSTKIAGHIYNYTLRGTVDKTLTLLDAPATAISWTSRKLDPTGRGIGKAPLQVAETAVPVLGGAKTIAQKGIQKGLQYSDEIIDAVNISRKLNPAYATVGVTDDIARSTLDTATDFKPNTTFQFNRTSRTPDQKKLVTANREFKPKGFNTTKWDNYIVKFGSKEGAEAAIKKAESSAKYLKNKGDLRGNNNIFTDPISGRKFLIKNKAKRGEISIGFDSLEDVSKTLAKRLEGQKLNTDEIYKIGEGLGWKKAKIDKYIETNEQAKRTLEALISDLNKGEGRTMWSLGHRTAVKELPHSADRALNIELEPLVDVLTEHGRTIKGNTGRAANDELIDLFKKITNNPTDLEADMIHWGDSLVGNFMPRMREIKNADDFFKEIVKREDFLEEIRKYSKKNKVSLEEAADVIMEPLQKKYPKLDEPTYFD